MKSRIVASINDTHCMEFKHLRVGDYFIANVRDLLNYINLNREPPKMKTLLFMKIDPRKMVALDKYDGIFPGTIFTFTENSSDFLVHKPNDIRIEIIIDRCIRSGGTLMDISDVSVYEFDNGSCFTSGSHIYMVTDEVFVDNVDFHGYHKLIVDLTNQTISVCSPVKEENISKFPDLLMIETCIFSVNL